MTLTYNWTRENIAWLSGLFEGEGCVSVRRQPGRNHRISVSIAMTDEDVIRKAGEIAGVGDVSGPYGPYRENEKALWRWQTTRYEPAQAILAAMYPFLGKRRCAKIKEVLEEVRSSELPARQYASKEHCGRKHLRTDHGYKNAKGHWICRTCRNITAQERKATSDKAN